jgi:hypothetical protein
MDEKPTHKIRTLPFRSKMRVILALWKRFSITTTFSVEGLPLGLV